MLLRRQRRVRFGGLVTIELGTPDAEGLGEVLRALGEWQVGSPAVQLHPGDVGWFWRFGSEATRAAMRTWRREGRLVAAGLLDEPTLLRLAIAPDSHHDEALTRRLVADLSASRREVFAGPEAALEAPAGSLLRRLLIREGWTPDLRWTPLRRDLADPVDDPGVRVEVIGPDQASARVAVQRSAFERSTFTDQRWRAMAGGPAYADARCLVAYDDAGAAVAALTVWSAGPGRPGLVEPMGVHPDHRGRGYGRAVALAGAAALREVGSSSVVVCTPSANRAAVATYVSAGLEPVTEVADLRRGASREP